VILRSLSCRRRHGLSLVVAVRGRTLRWLRHGYLPCYARVSITSRAPELGPQPSRHPDVSHPTGRAEPSKSAEKPTNPRRRAYRSSNRTMPGCQGRQACVSQVASSERFRPPMASRRRASWRAEGVVRQHEASPAGAPESGSLATPLMDANARWVRDSRAYSTWLYRWLLPIIISHSPFPSITSVEARNRRCRIG
jgi:hypothetical protein